MDITAEMVRELREKTAAGLMDCKRALTETSGNMEEAISYLRKKGQSAADKKSSRVTAEGSVTLKTVGAASAMVEVNCETDFVGKNDQFLAFGERVAEAALKKGSSTLADYLSGPLDEERKALVLTLGENIQIRRVSVVAANGGVLGAYSHSGRIGVIVLLKGGREEIAKDVAMHIAATNPRAIDAQGIDKDLLAMEREIYIAQALESGKPQNVAEKMVEGKVRKFLEENTLLSQPFVKNPDQTVAAYLKAHQAEVIEFVRFEMGEGIEKKTANYAEEVAEAAAAAKGH